MIPKTIHMLVGGPATGKSTWTAAHLLKHGIDNDIVVVSSDNIIEEYCAEEGITYSEGFDKYAGRAGQEMNRRCKAAIAEGKDIIWDQTNMTVKSRKRKLKQFEDYVKIAVVFIIADTEQKRRLDERFAKTGKFIPDFVVANMAKSYVRPSREEGFDQIRDVRS